MKRLLVIALAVLITSCNDEAPKDYVTLSGTITNPNSDSLIVANRMFKKVIAVNSDGSFSDTLKVPPAMYFFNDGSEGAAIFLRNGYDLEITLDTEQFDESLQFSGEGAENNNFLAEKALKEEALFDKDFSKMDMAGLENAMEQASDQLGAFIESKPELDSVLTTVVKMELAENIKSLKGYYGGMIALREAFPAGTPSPTFENYENFKGGTTSLSDLKGTYVYVDVWATWCAPCKAEIPYLKELESDMEDENITFVSLSIDDDRTHQGSWEQAKADWKAMVADKELGGVQIMAPNGWQSQFVQDYRIQGIPRFLLIDPDGNVVDPNAPRPSDPELRKMLAKLM